MSSTTKEQDMNKLIRHKEFLNQDQQRLVLKRAKEAQREESRNDVKQLTNYIDERLHHQQTNEHQKKNKNK
jgi:hypothetical protein